MWRDPIVEEVRKARAEFAAKFDNDLRAMAQALRDEQKEAGRQSVSFPPRKPARSVDAA